MKNSWLILLICIPTLLTAQPAVRKDTVGHPVQWPSIRENDILWKRRMWRRIEVFQQANWAFREHSTTPPQNMYAQVLISGLRAGKYSAYKGNDTGFTAAMPIYDVNALLQCDAAKLGKMELEYINFRKAYPNDNTDKFGSDSTPVASCVYPQQVRSYRLKEEWIFDRNKGEVVVRIQAVGPEVMVNDTPRVLFWVKYPALRDHAAQYAVYRRSTDSTKYNWDSFFEARQFASAIIQIDGASKQAADNWAPKQPPDGVKRRKKDKLSKKEAELWNY